MTPDFVGLYDGSSFETAMGMRIEADGQFEWGLSVGALDMRSSGMWDQDGDSIRLTTDPSPVPPEFRLLGVERSKAAPLVKVTWSTNGEPFQYAEAAVECSDGANLYEQVGSEGWSPAEGKCEKPVAITLIEGIYEISSPRYVLSELGWSPGMTINVEFRPNDLGVADFTGVTGRLEGDMLKLKGARWPLEMRKVSPRPDPAGQR